MTIRFIVLLSIFLAFASAKADPNPHKVHFVYLVPSDKTNIAESAIRNAALHLQAWYRWQMGNGKTFTLNDPIVEVYYTAHDSAWYSTNPCCPPYYLDPETNWFWDNSLIEAHELTLDPNAQNITGAWYCCEDFDDWVVYIDAAPSPTQFAGGSNGGTYMGFALMADKDLRSLMGIDPDWGQCRGIGGSGHEFGHTFGLAHPAEGSPEWYMTPGPIMGLGYLSYPSAILRQSDRDILNANPFFGDMPYTDPPVGLCIFLSGSPTPVPLQAPHADGADQIQQTSFRAKWHAINGAISYRIDIARDSHFINYTLQNVDVGNVTIAVVTGLTMRTDYYYRLRAYNGAISPNSNVIHVKTK